MLNCDAHRSGKQPASTLILTGIEKRDLECKFNLGNDLVAEPVEDALNSTQMAHRVLRGHLEIIRFRALNYGQLRCGQFGAACSRAVVTVVYGRCDFGGLLKRKSTPPIFSLGIEQVPSTCGPIRSMLTPYGTLTHIHGVRKSCVFRKGKRRLQLSGSVSSV
jgi:hypothetical protein